jgi:hypothetical protein
MGWPSKGSGGVKTAPKVPLMTSSHQQHGVLKSGGALAGSNIAVRHPALPGPNMMAPKADHAESPSGSVSSTAPGGIIGGLAPFQNAKGAQMGDFTP